MYVAEVRTRIFNAFTLSAFSSAYSCVRKSLVTRCVCVCVCVAEVQRAFSTCLSPALPPVPTVFILAVAAIKSFLLFSVVKQGLLNKSQRVKELSGWV